MPIWTRFTAGTFTRSVAGNQGVVCTDDDLFLWVTLDKDDLEERHRYVDHFVDRRTFQWQSQNRDHRGSARGLRYRDSAKHGVAVHLFVREATKQYQRSMPFTYCGPLTFHSWSGDRPITIRWHLDIPLSNMLAERFGT